MAPSLIKIASLLAAVVLLATPQAQGWAPEDDQVSDMVPVRSLPTEQELVEIPGGVGVMAGSSLCLGCRCCSKSNPSNCQTTTCSSSFPCDPGGKCHLVQTCGCAGGVKQSTTRRAGRVRTTMHIGTGWESL